MIGCRLKKVKCIRVSGFQWSLKLIDGEISDGISVFDTTLTIVRRIDTVHAYDVALLPRGNFYCWGQFV